jgi:hypothetical protein
MTRIGYPYRIDHRGRTATVDLDAHVRDLVEQVLFTAPGERVNRPSFGTTLRQALFAPNSQELGAAIEHMVHGALQQWLSKEIRVEGVEVSAEESTLEVRVRYVIVRNQQPKEARFVREV